MRPIRDVIVFDTEYTPRCGAGPEVICLVAQSVSTGQTWAWWRDQLATRPSLPFAPDEVLLVAFNGFGDMVVWQAADWPVVRFVDLALELTRLQNVDRAKGSAPHWWSLREALSHYGLPVPESRHKREMQELCARGGPEVDVHRDAILMYCQEDVAHTVALWRAMADEILTPPRRRQAICRGYAQQAEATWFRRGIPWDAELYHELETLWEPMQIALIEEINPAFGIYTPQRTFSHAAFNQWLRDRGVAWPTTKTGRMNVQLKVWKDMALAVPAVKPLADLFAILNAFKTLKVPVGPDGRVRTDVRVCGTKTGRNTASTAEYPFNLAPWLRHLLRPTPGTALVSLDYAAEEFQIAAVLSQDPVMRQAYASGDPYTSFARHVGAMPLDGDKTTHPDVRAKYKRTVLAVSYGMTAAGLAQWLQVSEAKAEVLLDQHRAAFPTFWEWSTSTARRAKLLRRIETRWGGWPLLIRPYTTMGTLMNYSMQAGGSDILHAANALLLVRQLPVIGTIHDSVMLEVPLADLEPVTATAVATLEEASRIVLGATVRVDVSVIRAPARYRDERGQEMWSRVLRLLRTFSQAPCVEAAWAEELVETEAEVVGA
jgi:DNA polymerase I-like protein with 3'-5' exonuclease and polymerase domains